MRISDLTPRAQQVMALARKEADRLNHQYVGTEHLLLGTVALGQGLSVSLLKRRGLDLESVRKEVEKISGRCAESEVVGIIPCTPRIKKVLAFAQEEAKKLNHTMVGTEHILLGLLRETDGPAALVFQSFGLDVENRQMEILNEMNPGLKSKDGGSASRIE
jgi:ATP-dependent Clp protease ATP-binding subunit ClpC